ncbi:hypothetical protein FB451DRAFT_72614 [Mycena latifolia]|nr:hypothetical protein FB451DRAFT_72614 [Mycena latifolia]
MSSICIHPQLGLGADSERYPEQRLPPEILMQVFSECCCSEQYPIHTSLAVLLSQVCWEWRDVALSMPPLWASFSLKIAQLSKAGFGQSDLQRDEIIFRLLRLHLERSAGYPLSFDVDFSKAETSPAALSLVSMLTEHSERWGAVKLPLSSALRPLFDRLSGRLGRLESLDLRLQGMNDPNGGTDCVYFEVAPRLRRLVLGSSLPRKLPFPKHQLTELHLGAAPTMEMLQFMTLCPCPHLTRLTLNPYFSLRLPNLPQSLPPFMHLHTLTLAIRDGYTRNPIVEVLNLLTTPTLQNLEVIGLREIRLPPQAFASFLERSGCTLQTLTIAFKENLPVPRLLSILRALPSLTHFAVIARGQDAMEAVDLILDSLTLSDPVSPHLLPNMASFELQTASFHPALLDMVASRVSCDPGCASLNTLALRNTPDTKAVRQRLQSLKARGLTVLCLPRYKPPRSTLIM